MQANRPFERERVAFPVTPSLGARSMTRTAKSILKRVKNWGEFKAILDDSPNKLKGDSFELLTQVYLQIEEEYTSKLKHVWLFSEIPAAVRKKLKLPSTDEGIDLIAETFEGEYWSIQSKYKSDETESVTKDDLATFLDLTQLCNISFGLVCTPANRRSKRLEHPNRNIGFIDGNTWRDLDEDFFRKCRSELAGRQVKTKPAKPRPHQKRAIKNAVKHFNNPKEKRGKLISPCGTGKSLTGYWIAKKLKPKTILIAVPSLYLVKQSLQTWAKEAAADNVPMRWMCVCSDKTVAYDSINSAS